MVSANNTEDIKNSLQAMQKIFAGLEDYRVLGSVLVAAINGKPHRELHDVDMLIDEKIYDEVAKRFREQGFSQVRKHAWGFAWDEFEKPEHLSFGILLRGSFKRDYFEYRPSRHLTLHVLSAYLTPTKYSLFDLGVRGIPVKSVREGIKIASLNTKRIRDRQIVDTHTKGMELQGPSLNQAFKVLVFGITVPYLYTVFSQVYNLVGGIRLRLGKSYDPWT